MDDKTKASLAKLALLMRETLVSAGGDPEVATGRVLDRAMEDRELLSAMTTLTIAQALQKDEDISPKARAEFEEVIRQGC